MRIEGLMGVGGGGGYRLLQKIYAVPLSGGGGLKFVLHRRPIIPFMPMRKITVARAEDITLSRAMQPLVAPVPPPAAPPQIGGVKRLEGTLMEAPLKIFHLAKSLVANDEFVMVKVKGGGTYALYQDGWVWERRVIDRLFRVEAKY